MYKVCECGRVCETKQSYCSHHGKCKIANPEGWEHNRKSLVGRKMPPSWNKGLTKETDNRLRQAGIKISQTLRTPGRDHSRIKESAQNRDPSCYKRQSETRKKKFMSGELTPPKGAGRGKYSYLTYNGKTIMLRSTYEFIYALYLLYNSIEFEYESVRVQTVTDYKYAKTFLSDFKIGNFIVEIKGYNSSKISHSKLAFEAAGYQYKVMFWKDLKPCYEYLKTKIDIDNILSKIKEGHDKKEYYEYKYAEE